MFGTLAPPSCKAGLPVVRTHRSYYCGTCQSLGAHFGHARRALLSHDAVFMAILVDALQEQAAPPSQCRCPMMPVAIRPTVAPTSVAMRYAAAMQMLLADQWLADRAVDGSRAAAVARPLVSRRPARVATAVLVELGVDLDALRDFELRQAAVEAEGRPHPLVAASPTAAVLAAVFETSTTLPGTNPRGRSPEARAELARLGAAVGTTIYLLDALEDLHDDARSGDFNACTDDDGDPCPQRIAAACRGLEESIAEAEAALGRIPLVRHRALLQAIVVGRLGARARRAIATARSQLESEARDALALWRTLPGSRRAMVRAMTALAFLWAWASSRLTMASGTGGTETDTETDTDTDGVSSTDTGTGTGGTSDGTSTGGDPTTGGSETDPPPDLDHDPWCDPCRPCTDATHDVLSGCGRECGSCFGACEGCGSQCSTCTKDCGNFCDGCGSCGNDCTNDCCGSGNALTGCCNGCGDGCRSCGDCGGACNGCGKDCGGCGKGCGDCGNACNGCGKGCGDCGGSCNGCGNSCDGCGQGCGQGCGGGGGACCH